MQVENDPSIHKVSSRAKYMTALVVVGMALVCGAARQTVEDRSASSAGPRFPYYALFVGMLIVVMGLGCWISTIAALYTAIRRLRIAGRQANWMWLAGCIPLGPVGTIIAAFAFAESHTRSEHPLRAQFGLPAVFFTPLIIVRWIAFLFGATFIELATINPEVQALIMALAYFLLWFALIA